MASPMDSGDYFSHNYASSLGHSNGGGGGPPARQPQPPQHVTDDNRSSSYGNYHNTPHGSYGGTSGGFSGSYESSRLPARPRPSLGDSQSALRRQASSSHGHSDTGEVPLPAEALGASQLVDFLFRSDKAPQRGYSNLSPRGAVMQSKREEIGLPLPLVTEPVNPSTGRRLVYLGRGQPPVAVRAERKSRFIAVARNPIIATGAPSAAGAYSTSYGTVLGYSDCNQQIIWHERSERFASRLHLSDILMIHRATALRCRHCGQVLLEAEAREHLATHTKGSGVVWGVFNGDDAMGLACGDTGLIQRMTFTRRLAEGAQGVVELFSVARPTPEQLAAPHMSREEYSHPCRHFNRGGSITEAVRKTMHMPSREEGLAQYEKSIRLMTILEHDHLVEYLAVQLSQDCRTLQVTMPYYPEGDLAKAVEDRNNNRFDESFLCSVALQLSLALSFLHERNPPIVHGDIKVENVMFYNDKQRVVLMDLDASHEVRLTQNAVETNLGTAAYMAPETMNNERLMPASDMWSLGVLLYILAVMPDYPMISDPQTGEDVMMNATTWATPADLRAIDEFLADRNSCVARPTARRASESQQHGGSATARLTLGDCVRMNVSCCGYSAAFTQVIVDLLSYNPFKRPSSEEVGERMTEIMTNNLLAGA